MKTRFPTLFLAMLVGLPACTVSFGSPDSVCGDGVIQGPETCDDINTLSDDGCSAACQVEEGWSCLGDPSSCETTCGDGLAVGTEACDGADLRSLSCPSLGLGNGDLACAATCIFDTSGCEIQAECGNGAAEYPEECDGSDLFGQTCLDQGFVTGELSCAPDCTYDVTRCVSQSDCGDGVAESPEECDGNDLAGQTCADLGLGTGALVCSSLCTFDVGGCSDVAECGNDTIEFPEVCDGADLDGQTCQDRGYYTGQLYCVANCTGFNESACSGICGDSTISGPELCDGANLGGDTCQDFGFYSGQLACAGNCLSVDTSACQGSCGDNTANGPEDCDGADLNGQTCVTEGYFGGTLACTSVCAYDTSGCHQTPQVKINELSMGIPDAVELVNLSLVAVNLQGWRVETWTMNGGIPESYTFDLPSYLLTPGEHVALLDEYGGSGAPPTVNTNTRTIQYHDNVLWGGGLLAGSATLYDDANVPLDFVRWGLPDFGPPAALTWVDTPYRLQGHSGDNTTLSRVPNGLDTDTAGDFCATLATLSQANSSCLDAQSGVTVLITEIAVGNPDQLELYNAGSVAVNLQGWTVYWYHDSDNSAGGTSLPAYVLAAGQYVTLMDDLADSAIPYVTGNLIHINGVNWSPMNSGGGGLVDPAQAGRDFVRWGGSVSTPMAPDQFTDQPTVAPIPGFNYSLGRQNLADTDIAGDWCLQNDSFGSSNGFCQ